MVEVRPEMPRPCLTVYFHVDDMPALLKNVEQDGGKVPVPQTPIHGADMFAVIGDPDGLHFGIYRPQEV